MKFRNAIFALVAITFLGASPARAKESPYPEFIQLMHNFDEISTAFTVDMFSSAVLIGQALSVDPNVAKIKSVAGTISEKAESLEKASSDIQTFLAKNKSSLGSVKDVADKIEADSAPDNVTKAKELASSLAAFAEAATEQQFTVYANEGWANSGITVSPGDIIWVNASGGWSVSNTYDAVGWKGYICHSSDMYNLNKSAPLGALLYRVRGSSKSDGFPLDENKRGQIDASGRLEFIINDSDRRNNQGQLDLKVVVLNGEKLKGLLQLLQNTRDDNKE